MTATKVSNQGSDELQPVDIIVQQVEKGNEQLLQMLQTLLRQVANRNFVIRNYEGNSVLQVPLSTAIIGGVVLTSVLKLRSVLLLALGAALGRVYFSIEPFADNAEKMDVLLEDEDQEQVVRSSASRTSAAKRKSAAKTATKSTKKSSPSSSNGSR
ncbi:MAG: DUF4342 domain-containing protein [Anaerolineae bacterium]|nr:DUF4342 domain-containing protein [Anaerolineae bacterium]